MARVRINIVTCPTWKARYPKGGWAALVKVDAPNKVLIHHTAGHHPEISGPQDESLAEAIRYAQQIQAMHMAPGGLGAPNGGIDSGHNFLVCRNGIILQGRWRTVTWIEEGAMVQSAHCVGQNDQVGIEHEHVGLEAMTPAQFEASARLQAWIAQKLWRAIPLPAHGHKEYNATACPANLQTQIPRLVARAQEIMRTG